MNRSPARSTSTRIVACLAALAAGACGTERGTGPQLRTSDDPASTVFIAQDAVPGAFMDALYRGTVTRDAAGCLRMEGPDRHTVIWPAGYTLEARDDALYVKDGQGSEVGPIGGAFSIAGGEVSSIGNVQHLSPDKRALAQARCPGRYWIAAP